MKCISRKWAKGRGNCDVKKWLFPVQHSPYLRPTHKQEERWDGGLRGWKRQRGKWESGRMIKEDWSGEEMMVRKLQKRRRKERYWMNLSDLVQFHTLADLVSLSSNYFNIILSSSWKRRRRFLLCCPMMSFTSLQGTKSPSAQNPNPQPQPNHSRPLLMHSWIQARFLIYQDMWGVNLPDLVLRYPDFTAQYTAIGLVL